MTARVDPPYAADERTMLVSFLDYFRETMCLFLEGLDEEQARIAPTPQANSLIGLVNHLAYVEHSWFHEILLGLEPELPDIFAEDEDADFKPPADQTIAQTIERYRAECARSNEITAAAGLDDVAKHPKGAKRGVTLRWILVHMIEETARHAGHLDLMREQIDGTTGA